MFNGTKYNIIIGLLLVVAFILAPLAVPTASANDIAMDHSQMGAMQMNMSNDNSSHHANMDDCQEHCADMQEAGDSDMVEDCVNDCLQNVISHVAFLVEQQPNKGHKQAQSFKILNDLPSVVEARFITPPPKA